VEPCCIHEELFSLFRRLFLLCLCLHFGENIFFLLLSVQIKCSVGRNMLLLLLTLMLMLFVDVAVCCVWLPCCEMLRHVRCCWVKFDQFQTWANNTWHVVTHRNTVAKRTRHAAPNNVAICCVGMLQSFGRGFRIVKFKDEFRPYCSVVYTALQTTRYHGYFSVPG